MSWITIPVRYASPLMRLSSRATTTPGLRDHTSSGQTGVAERIRPDHLGDPTIADAVLDRLVHNAHRIVLKGPSRRKITEDTES